MVKPAIINNDRLKFLTMDQLSGFVFKFCAETSSFHWSTYNVLR